VIKLKDFVFYVLMILKIEVYLEFIIAAKISAVFDQL